MHLGGALARRAPEATGGRGGNGPANDETVTEFLDIFQASIFEALAF